MMLSNYRNASFIAVLILGIVLITCKKNEDSEPNTPTNKDITGTYNGNLSLHQESHDGQFVDDDNSYATVTATGSGTSFTLTISSDFDDDASIEVSVTGNNFSGTDGTLWLADTKVTGSLSGNLMTFSYSGSDSWGKWNGDFAGEKESGNGGPTGTTGTTGTTGNQGQGPCIGTGTFDGASFAFIEYPNVCGCSGQVSSYGVNGYKGTTINAWFGDKDDPLKTFKVNIVFAKSEPPAAGAHSVKERVLTPGYSNFGTAQLLDKEIYMIYIPRTKRDPQDDYYPDSGSLSVTDNGDGTRYLTFNNVVFKSDFDGKEIIVSANWTCLEVVP